MEKTSETKFLSLQAKKAKVGTGNERATFQFFLFIFILQKIYELEHHLQLKLLFKYYNYYFFYKNIFGMHHGIVKFVILYSGSCLMKSLIMLSFGLCDQMNKVAHRSLKKIQLLSAIGSC